MSCPTIEAIPAYHYEQLKQWSNALGLTLTREVSGAFASQYRQLIYGDGTQLQGYHGENVGHTVPVFEQQMLEFFGLLGGSTPPTPPIATTITGGPTIPTITPTLSPPGLSQTLLGQCGGSGWNTPTTCVTTAKCTTQNAWYAQRVPR